MANCKRCTDPESQMFHTCGKTEPAPEQENAVAVPPYNVEVAKIVAAGLVEQRRLLIVAVTGVQDGYNHRALNLAKLNEQINTIDKRLDEFANLGM